MAEDKGDDGMSEMGMSYYEYSRNIKLKHDQILNDEVIRNAILCKADLLGRSIPIGIGKNCEYIFNDEVNKLLNKFDEDIMNRIKNIVGNDEGIIK